MNNPLNTTNIRKFSGLINFEDGFAFQFAIITKK